MATLQKNKSGAALVIVLGFLAVLTITIIAFSTQTRSERLAGRAYTSAAQTRHLLSAALTRALEDIDVTATSNYPNFFSFGSKGDTGSLLSGTINFDVEENYFTVKNERIEPQYAAELNSAEWQTITTEGKAIGRVGYIVVNSSGLLDANNVGGTTSSGGAAERNAGTSPREIQLSNTLLSEFNNASTAFPHIDSESTAGIRRSAEHSEMSAGLAFAFNRENAWKRFETLREVYSLNRIGEPKIITGPIKNFSTFSFSPNSGDRRTFMGTNSATLDEAAIEHELSRLSAVSNTTFVMNQLRDYLDTDSLPEDIEGNYTDLSVEPVPLINELALNCTFGFFPIVEESTDDSGEPIYTVTDVVISNHYEVELEVWYPFTGYENKDTYTIRITESPIYSGDPSDELLGEISSWTGDFPIPQTVTIPAPVEPKNNFHNFPIHSFDNELTVGDLDDFEAAFESLQTDIQFSGIYCVNSQNEKVDQVIDLELPMEDAVATELLTDISTIASNYFINNLTTATSNYNLSVGMSCVDPRLNWNGASKSQWKEESDAGEDISTDTLGSVNATVIQDFTETPDDTDKIFVRNTDVIDTPWEFTYFLYDIHQPWKTFQMMEANDEDDTRYILQNLSPYPEGAVRNGRINPYSPHENVIASAFLNLPLDNYNVNSGKRLTSKQALQAAEKFITYYSNNLWPADAAHYTTNIYETMSSELNTWEQEGFFRNTWELFTPRDTLYTVLLCAQDGTDINANGRISNNEVRGTQKAIAYIWRDPETQQAACVFYGISDSLPSQPEQSSWSALLREFRP